MKTYLVFYAGLLYDEVNHWSSSDLPDGAYVFGPTLKHQWGQWYLIRHAGHDTVDLDDVPKELRMLALLLGVG